MAIPSQLVKHIDALQSWHLLQKHELLFRPKTIVTQHEKARETLNLQKPHTPLLRLPGELRNQIYEHVLGNLQIHIHHTGSINSRPYCYLAGDTKLDGTSCPLLLPQF